jgi:hypothetical protein
MGKNKLMRWYGNRGFLFDLVVSVVFGVAFILFNNYYSIFSLGVDLINSLLNFFGILAGFMLTAFSLLLLYNPSEKDSPKFNALRKSEAFKKALKYFIFSILIILISTSCLFILTSNPVLTTLKVILVFLLLLSLIMVLRCLYYLFAIIDFE